MQYRYIGYGFLLVAGVGLNGLALLRQVWPPLPVISVVALLLLVGVTEKFAQTFAYPLFFVRDELNYWGGLFGGLFAMFSYGVATYLFRSTLVSTIGAVSLFILFFAVLCSALVAYTGTLLRDVEQGYAD